MHVVMLENMLMLQKQTSICVAAGSRVGYHVRLDASMTRATRLLFCTTGILLRRLGGDLHLPDVSHIIVDEVNFQQCSGQLCMNLCALNTHWCITIAWLSAWSVLERANVY